MTNGVFKPSDFGAFTRAINVMSTKSATDFEWSLKLVGTANINVGIASQLIEKKKDIFDYDQNAILYTTPAASNSNIKSGSKIIHSSLMKYKTGDIIRFRFQPHEKKLVIDLVRLKLKVSNR